MTFQKTALLAAAMALAAGLVIAAAGAADSPQVNGETGRRIDEYMARLARLGYSGSAVVVKGNDVLLMKAYGLADRAKGIPLGTDSVFSLGSITKQFTAAAILTLEMQGRLSVSDPIAKYLGPVPADKAAITLHHLLTHSSGLESDFAKTDFEPVARDEYVRRALASKLLFEPGRGYEYSNAGYSVLAAIVEKVSGQDYEAYLAEHVLKPAGMRETGYKLPSWNPARIAHGYRDGEEWGTLLQRIQPPDAPHWQLRGNGGLHTTLGDMVAWHRALDGSTVLSKEARSKYFTPYVAEGPQQRSFYAYGWAVGKTKRGTTVVQHNGGNGIFVAEFLRFPDENAMLFVTSTDGGFKATPVVAVLEEILFGGKYELPPAVVDVPPARLSSLAGRWMLPKGGALTLVADGAALMAQPDGEEAFRVMASPANGAQSERFARLTARTADVSARAFKGDVSGLQDAMGGQMALDTLRQQEAGMMRDRESRLGAFKGSTVLGTQPGQEDTAQAIVRLDFDRGSVFNIYVWGPMRLLGIRGTPQLPGVRFVPISEREFIAFALDGPPRSTRLRFEDRGGKLALVVETPGGEVSAHR